MSTPKEESAQDVSRLTGLVKSLGNVWLMLAVLLLGFSAAVGAFSWSNLGVFLFVVAVVLAPGLALLKLAHSLRRKKHRLASFVLTALAFTFLALLILPLGGGSHSASSRERAYVSSMKSDLRNLATAQESYFADNVTYTTSLMAVDFAESERVTITIAAATGSGWSATASHNGTARTCGIFLGNQAAVAPADTEGEVKCTD